MIEQVAAAFERQDYQEAARLLKELPAQDPWAQLFQGRLHEEMAQPVAAEAVYREVLRTATGSKITLQARQGLQRLAALEQEQRQLNIAQATVEPKDIELGLLVLEPLLPEAKSLAVPKFAQVMKIDPYLARLQLPTRGWRLYRTGPVGELRVYTQALQAAGIPAFWLPLSETQQIQVVQVSYFQAIAAQVTVAYVDAGIESVLKFQWSEVTQQVLGLLPLFEEVFDFVRGKPQRQQKTQDHAQVCDLHLPGRNCILRFYDSGYQFQQGINLASNDLTAVDRGTSWANWRHLLGFLQQHLSQIPVSDFSFFAETALEHVERMDIEPHINLFRRVESTWDQAFHLYSCLVFLKNKM